MEGQTIPVKRRREEEDRKRREEEQRQSREEAARREQEARLEESAKRQAEERQWQEPQRRKAEEPSPGFRPSPPSEERARRGPCPLCRCSKEEGLTRCKYCGSSLVNLELEIEAGIRSIKPTGAAEVVSRQVPGKSKKKQSIELSEEQRSRQGRVVKEIAEMTVTTIVLSIGLSIALGIVGCVAGVFAQGENSTSRYGNGGLIIGLVLGIILGTLSGIRNCRRILNGKD